MNDIRVDLLDTPISDQDICKIAAHYLDGWEDLSPELGLTHNHEIVIRKTFRDYSDQKREALRKWKKLKDEEATYRAFIDAAKKVDNMQLAGDVKRMRNRPTGNMTHPL